MKANMKSEMKPRRYLQSFRRACLGGGGGLGGGLGGGKSRRGFTLIEIAIVLVIVGIVLGGVLVPAYQQARISAYDRERARMEDIKTAIFGYAARQRTRGNLLFGSRADVFAVSNNYRGARLFSLPVGRPYLPCPDVNGDGWEDRMNYDQTGFVFTAPAAPLVPAGQGTLGGRNLYLTDIGVDPAVQPLVDIGRCVASRGILPWRTLGVQPADIWGNLYIYYADAVASDALVGFNQNTNIDEFDIRTQVRPIAAGSDFVAFDRRAAETIILPRNGQMVTITNSARPLVVCSGLPCVIDPPSSFTGDTILEEGEEATGDLNVLYRNFEEGDIINGAPFAVVSAGKNGSYAPKYDLLLRQALLNNEVKIQCVSGADFRQIVSDPLNLGNAETYNTLNPRLSKVSDNWGRPCQGPIGNVGGESNVFVNLPLGSYSRIGGSAQNPDFGGDYDDIVVWSSMGELVEVMRKNEVLPAPDLFVLREY